MKRILVLLFGALLCLNLYGQNDTAFIYTFGGIQDDGCRQIMPTPDGGYIMIGTTSSFGHGNTDFYAIKLDSSCKFKWSGCYGGVLNEEGFSVIPTMDKGFAFVGFTNSFGSGGYDAYLVKTDSMGREQWQKTYGGSNWDFGYSVKQLKDSGYLIAGTSYSYGFGNGNIYIIRTDKNGDTLWGKTAGGMGYSEGNSISIVNDSIYLIAGGTTSYSLNGDTNACLIKIKDCGDSGSILATWLYGGQKNSKFYSIRRLSDKGFVMYGSNDSIPDSTEASLFPNEYCPKIDSAGLMKWTQLIHFHAAGVGKDAIELSDHSILSLGSNEGGGDGGFDFHVQRFDANGNYLQATTFGGPRDELAGSIAIGKNGDLVFAGSSDSYPLFSCGLFDVFIVRLKSTDTIPIPYDTLVYRYIDTSQYPASLSILQSRVGVNVFPNPVINSATILIQGEAGHKYTFNLYAVNGKWVVNSLPLLNVGHEQSVAIMQRGDLATGEYCYEIISDGNVKVAEGKILMK